MIEHVESIHAKLERVRLLDRERFLDRDVPVLLIRRAPGIARSGAEAGSSRIDSAVDGGETGDVRRQTKAFLSQIVIETLLRGPLRVGVRDPVAQKLRGAGCRAKNAAAGAVGDRERQALLVGDDSAYSPTPENRIIHEAVLPHRDVVGVTYDQTMRAIKVAARFVLRHVGLIVKDVGPILAGTRVAFNSSVLKEPLTLSSVLE